MIIITHNHINNAYQKQTTIVQHIQMTPANPPPAAPITNSSQLLLVTTAINDNNHIEFILFISNHMVVV